MGAGKGKNQRVQVREAAWTYDPEMWKSYAGLAGGSTLAEYFLGDYDNEKDEYTTQEQIEILDSLLQDLTTGGADKIVTLPRGVKARDYAFNIETSPRKLSVSIARKDNRTNRASVYFCEDAPAAAHLNQIIPTWRFDDPSLEETLVKGIRRALKEITIGDEQLLVVTGDDIPETIF